MKKLVKIEDKQNISIIKQNLTNPINNKIQKFGKCIRSKVSQKNTNINRTTTQSLYPNTLGINKPVVSVQFQRKPQQKDEKLSTSYLFTKEEESSEHQSSNSSLVNSRNNISMSKKSVRFTDNNEEGDTSLSKSKCKGQSILKNSRSSDKLSSDSVNSHVGYVIESLSAKASLKDQGLYCDNKKYQNALSIITYQNKKFFDDMFPPGGASLFHSKNLTQKGKEIRWMRVEDIYRGQRLILYNHQDRNIVKNGEFQELSFMATGFNALRTSPRCIERIFENQKYSKLGLYYLRLNHEGIWKYVLVDDFIPVRQIGRNYIPVFMNVQPQKFGPIQIWPLLLQKALAKMYSTYECLFNDSIENLMQELTGVITQKIELSANMKQKNELIIKNYLMNENHIFIANQPLTNNQIQLKQPYYALCQNKKSNSALYRQQVQLKLISTYKNYQLSSLPLENFHLYFKNILFYKIDDSYYSMGCIIKQQKGSMSLRTFKVDGSGNCSLSVIQKDRKYFRNNGYEYSWMRVMLICKDLQGYRYINGSYGKDKIVNINSHLQSGQYFVLVIGDWDKKVFDVTLNYQGNVQVQIQREQITKYPKMIDEMCSDMAQRFGSSYQINKNLCSYQWIDKQNGLILQNYNNETPRQIYLHRRYKIPFINFVNIGSLKFKDDQSKNVIKKQKIYQIQTFLQPEGNLSMALMLIGGVNEQEIMKFNFNSY